MNAPSYICLVCTIGFSMIIKSLAQVFFGGETKGMPTVFEKKFYDLGPLRISNLQLLIFGVVIALSLLLTILDEPNVLILDEPGNDLDTDMLAIVEDLLDGWPGTAFM